MTERRSLTDVSVLPLAAVPDRTFRAGDSHSSPDPAIASSSTAPQQLPITIPTLTDTTLDSNASPHQQQHSPSTAVELSMHSKEDNVAFDTDLRFTDLDETAEANNDTPPDETAPAPKGEWKAKAWDLWMKNWFLLGLVVVIILARFFPKWGRTGGPIRPEYTVKYGVTSCIFLLSGLSLKTKDILVSAMNYRAHLLTQLTSFIVIPLWVKAITTVIGLTGLNAKLLAGMAVTSATPTTISSNVVMTANSDGSESLALFNAALGNLLGVFFSPLIVLLLLDGTAMSPSGKHGLDYPTILRDLGSTILLPIIVGQIYLYFFPRSIAWAKRMVHFPTLNSTCLLILVWTVFCDAFNNNTFASVTAGEIIAVGGLQAFTFWTATFFLAFMARIRPAKLRILKIMDQNQRERERQAAQLEQGVEINAHDTQDNRYAIVTQGLSLPRTKFQTFTEQISKVDTVAILFCGATKSVAMGIPMIKILYASNATDSLAGLLATPLLCYHVEQLFSGAFMVGFLKKWVNRGEETLETFEIRRRKKAGIVDPEKEPSPAGELDQQQQHTAIESPSSSSTSVTYAERKKE
ncbi:solute carrier family 10 (sodium/bile acid cotransporter), member 7 [Entomortierella parvispora]|uniref:Solute carrier family 10 (Sodium/bile acid cotransporter), member 7 n=1 Tax=Entomortierella parvispora TaxID=205924 RepID=A0A9P3LW60_9FUNG|nr:solute carrier family 10 (sodium/bile acid cotransporter), member 7 [Entomortierella parvispora]